MDSTEHSVNGLTTTVTAGENALTGEESETPEQQSAEAAVAPATEVEAEAAPVTEVEEVVVTAPPLAMEATAEKVKWPGWPGDCVFRLVVPVLKVGSIIGRKGEFIKKMCEETRARVRVLDGPTSSPDRIVLISGKEEPEALLSPAMDAVMRVFKRVSGLPESEGDAKAPGAAFCSIRLLVSSTQAINLIGKQGSSIRSIQENAGASVRVLSNDETPIYSTSDDRIVELQGEALKVLKALELVIGHLRKFLVDHSVVPLFEKSYDASVTQERQEPWSDKTVLSTTSQPGLGSAYPLQTKRESSFFERESQLESPYYPSGPSLYAQDPGFSGIRPTGVGRAGGPIVTQISQTVQMQIPLAYAEAIIGVQGANIAYIRRTSGAILTVQESRGLPDEITVEIKGTSSQVETAQQLIQEFMGGQKQSRSGSYGKLDTGYRPSYSHLGSGSYPSSSYSEQQYDGGYGSSGLGGYSSYRL